MIYLIPCPILISGFGTQKNFRIRVIWRDVAAQKILTSVRDPSPRKLFLSRFNFQIITRRYPSTLRSYSVGRGWPHDPLIRAVTSVEGTARLRAQKTNRRPQSVTDQIGRASCRERV